MAVADNIPHKINAIALFQVFLVLQMESLSLVKFFIIAAQEV
jgi:hypothetical protein